MQEMGEVFIDDIAVDTVDDDLKKVKLLTQMMREHQNSVVRLGKQRRLLVRQLRRRRIPYRLIAEWCGVTDQALFADLRKHPEDEGE